ncbi:hypothetical protein B0H13DRAFT_1897269 [Mycena leptocephala]|nr:hypothetical protein B0H13DRAFT_1897269 [Mycena leptocephala]
MLSPLKSVWLSSVMLSGGGSGTVTVAARAVSSAAEFGGGAGEVAGVAGLGAREEKRLDAVSDDSSEMSGVTALGLGRNLPEAARCGYGGPADAAGDPDALCGAVPECTATMDDDDDVSTGDTDDTDVPLSSTVVANDNGMLLGASDIENIWVYNDNGVSWGEDNLAEEDFNN